MILLFRPERPADTLTDMKNRFILPIFALVIQLAPTQALWAADNPFVGYWNVSLPGSVPGWLGVEERGGALKASMLWGWGSVTPLDSARVEDGKLIMTRQHEVNVPDVDGKQKKTKFTETITVNSTSSDKLAFVSVKPRPAGGEERAEFTAQRMPPMPAKPDLTKVKFGRAIRLFNGKNLNGWRLTDPKAVNGWSARNGILVNDATQEKGKPHKNYGNLRTEREFEDFNLQLEARVAKNGNSGIYLRGIYEVQVEDSFGKSLDPHNMGGIYSRITPSVSAEKPAGEWQAFDITLVNRHVTVVLNGKKIIDNQPLLGCTGGALWTDVTRPGPIYLQGDHTGVEYRNFRLRPVK